MIKPNTYSKPYIIYSTKYPLLAPYFINLITGLPRLALSNTATMLPFMAIPYATVGSSTRSTI